MIIETQVFAALQGMAGGRIFPDFAPPDTALPFITFQAVGGAPINMLSADVPDKENNRVQVNVWAVSRIEASELGKEIEILLRQAPGMQTEVLTGRVATFDDATGYRGTMQDFSFFS